MTIHTRAIWGNPRKDQFIGKGHGAGDFLRASEWKLLEEREGYIRVEAFLVDAVKNYSGNLFGGFAPTYVDLVALRTVSAGRPLDVPHSWLLTVNMRVDFFEPISGPTFVIESEIENRRGRTLLIETKFRDPSGKMQLFAITTLREQSRD